MRARRLRRDPGGRACTLSAMTAVPDQQTVTPDGKAVQPLIDGVVVRRGVTHVDERGALYELYDPRWGVHPADLVYAYITTTRPGWAKGWGLHHHHDDRYVIWQGRVELALYDARAGSRTEGLESRLFLSEADRCLVTTPAGVWHAERNIGDDEVVIVNFPTEPFHHAAPDKERLPLDNDFLPEDLGPDWRGCSASSTDPGRRPGLGLRPRLARPRAASLLAGFCGSRLV